jgi:hypothetical protein
MAGKGTSEPEIEKKLQDVNSFSGSGAKQFIVIAAKSYCPSQLTPDEPSKTPGEGDSSKPPGA